MKHTPIASRMISGAARSAPTPTLRGAQQSILARARAQITRELGPRPDWAPENDAVDFVRDMAGSFGPFPMRSRQEIGERWLQKMAVQAAARRWDRAVSDRCKLLGMAPTLIGDA